MRLIQYGSDPCYEPGSFCLYYNGDAGVFAIAIGYTDWWAGNWVSVPFDADGKWHHFAMVIDPDKGTGNSAYLYIDFEKVATLSWMNNRDFTFGNSIFTIGSGTYSHSANNFTGLIDDIRIYNIPLAPSQFVRTRTKGYSPFVLILR